VPFVKNILSFFTEEAVQEVKRQALVELKRAVAAAEARACEAVASERARLERVLLDSRRAPGEICSSIVVGVGASSLPIESEVCATNLYSSFCG